MSTFKGKIKEIPNISIDRFEVENYNSSEVFFLSHCHTDHMKGLNSDFFKKLKEDRKCLYTSGISCVILENQLRLSSEEKLFLKPLTPYVRTYINIQENNIPVIAIPVNHCPGSMMFIFESNPVVLYTGDYRIYEPDIETFFRFLKNYPAIDKIYLDTTFFAKRYRRFPTREESIQELCEIIQNKMKSDNEISFNIKTGSYYGNEDILKEIYQKFGMPVHINRRYYDELYRFMPEMDKCITIDPNVKTRFHWHCVGYFQVCDINCYNIELFAKPWTVNYFENGAISKYTGYNVHSICYSQHCSYEESVAFLMYLKPKEIEICVKHKKKGDKHEDDKVDLLNQEIEEAVNDILSYIKKIVTENEPKELGPEKVEHPLNSSSSNNCESTQIQNESHGYPDNTLNMKSPRKRMHSGEKNENQKHFNLDTATGNHQQTDESFSKNNSFADEMSCSTPKMNKDVENKTETRCQPNIIYDKKPTNLEESPNVDDGNITFNRRDTVKKDLFSTDTIVESQNTDKDDFSNDLSKLDNNK